jgi:hypothetical protein
MLKLAVIALALGATLSLGCGHSASAAATDGPVVMPDADAGAPHDVAAHDAAPDGSVCGGGDNGYASVHDLLTVCWGSTTCSSVSIPCAVVTAVTPSGKELWVQDLAGGPRSGISVYCNPASASAPCLVPTATILALRPGNVVQLSGVWSPYHGKNMIRPTSITVVDATALPAPTPITAAQADPLLPASDYAGVLVTVTTAPLTVVGASAVPYAPDGGSPCQNGPTPGLFQVSDGTSTIDVETTFFDTIDIGIGDPCLPALDGGAARAHVVRPGDTFTKLGGILDWDTVTGQLVLQPTDPSQYTYAATGDHDGG